MAEEKLPMLTARAQKIIEALARRPRQRTTTAALAEALHVSRRTILRELPCAEQWLAAAGFELQNVPGQGLTLNENAERCRALLAKLAGDEHPAPDREERRVLLLAKLFAARAPVSSQTMAQELGVSAGTFAADLDGAEEWLRPYQVRLRRKPGVGVWLEGDAAGLRHAQEALLRRELSPQELEALMQRQLPPKKSMLATLLDLPTACLVWGILMQTEETEAIHFTDAGLITLSLHLTLVLQQLLGGEVIAQPVQPERGEGYEPALRLAERLEKAFSLRLPTQEVNYLVNCLSAYRTQPQDGALVTAEDLNLRNLSALLIAEVSQSLGVDLSRWPSLSDDLSTHLRLMLHRLKQAHPAENPQLEVIQTEYAALWEATRAACDTASRTLELPDIPDEEAGFLAMHFGAVLEQDSIAKMRLCAVVVCPFGISTSKFLASQLVRDFPVLHVQTSCSIRELSPESLRAAGADLVISTVPLELDFPTICVNPILQEADRTHLRDFVARVRQTPAAKPTPPPPQRGTELRYMQELSATLLELLDTLTVRRVDIPKTRQALIHTAASMFCPTAEKRQLVEAALLQREAMGDTYIKPLQAVLLHCRTKAVSGCRLGYLQAQPPVYENGKFIRGALVLLAPDNDSDIPLEVVRSVSALLIENPMLMESLRSRDLRRATRVLEDGLNRQFAQRLGRS